MDLSLIVTIVIVALLLGLIGFIVTRPDSFRMERSTVINAPPAKVYALIDNFHEWMKWSPWEKMDAAGTLQRTYDGPASGLGARYGWTGPKTGQGTMEIVEAITPSKVRIKLDFLKPFEAHNTAEFTLTPEGDGTRVVWAMYGPQPLIAKAMSLVFSTEKMVGPSFEQGLADMKAAAEA